LTIVSKAVVAAAKGVANLRDQYVGSADTNLAFGPNGEIINAADYEEGAATGGPVKRRGYSRGIDNRLAHAASAGARRGGRIRAAR
jgi:hypothetical protein